MRVGVWAAGVAAAVWCGPSAAVEGPAAAGPIGGTDMRSALPLPPGFYGGTVQAYAETRGFVDGKGNRVFGLEDAKLTKAIGGPFLMYVPDATVYGGLLTFGGLLPFVRQCGKLFAGQDRACENGMGDPYVEAHWSRFFGTWRPSKHPDAYPIPEGLSVLFGLGAVIPVGEYDHRDPRAQAISAGTGIWDVSPTVALTYTTPAWLGEGTEFSAKLFWNNYFENRKTDYRTGDLVNLDFAVTERFGPLQAGLAGIYAFQPQDDRISGRRIPPDGRRGELLQLGGVAAYDLPSLGTSLKVKATTTAHAENTVRYWSVVTSWITKF
ncbi:SphA family protein [Chenggangzhangella methanolivorans]|uniref:Transporter n=1 Tax=Chenggangzhangella methanolivorans TaxID=1437009 RepID=A0A9E6RAQ8_9HYPH|nr:transporter [Chenggangzhangella methanolivorans]QZO00390.1 transporter [Chenggangzhangella methanolivorans]